MPSGDKETKQTDPHAHDAVVLRRDGLAIRAIARVLGVSRNTARQPAQLARRRRADQAEPQVSLQLLRQRLRQK